MAEEEKDEEESEEGEEDEEEGEGGASKSNKKKKLIMISALVIIIAAAAYFFVFKKSSKSDPASPKLDNTRNQQQPSPEDKVVYFDLEEFIVNLEQNAGQPSFLKVGITLEVSDEMTAERIKNKMPIIRDTFQIYLRELRPEDLQGSAGIFRLREELMLRLAKIVYPDKVIDILFKEILVQ